MLLLFNPKQSIPLLIPLVISRVKAGFPSPAGDYVEDKLDLNEKLIAHPSATFFITVSGESMIEANIHDGDTLIVDRSLEAKQNDVVIASIDNEFTVKRLVFRHSTPWLIPGNPAYPEIELSSEQENIVWGVVTSVIHSFR